MEIWDYPARTLWRTLETRQGDSPCCLAFVHSDAILVAAVGYSHPLCTWNVEMGTTLQAINVPHSIMSRVVGSPDHSYVLAWDWPTTDHLTIHDAWGGELLGRLESQTAAKFVPDGASFISSGTREGLTIWHIRTLLEQGQRDGGFSGSDSEGPTSTGTVLRGPQVRPDSSLCNSDDHFPAPVGQYRLLIRIIGWAVSYFSIP